MDEDLQPRKFTANYPTASCLIGGAILGLFFAAICAGVFFAIIVPWLAAHSP